MKNEIMLISINSGIPTMISLSNQSTREHLRILEQPYQNSKLRYRADYVREKGRLGVLGNKNETSRMKGPVIHVCLLQFFSQSSPFNRFHHVISIQLINISFVFL